jgi:hypothetical protein
VLAACSKSDRPADDAKTSPLADLVRKTASWDSAATLTPALEARGFRVVWTGRLPAQLASRRATAAAYRSADDARGGVIYMQRTSNVSEGITWHWYFADGAPDSVQLLELNGDGLWDVRVYMTDGGTRDFIQGETFSLMTDRHARFAMNGASSTNESWKAFDGDTTTAWRSSAREVFVEIPLPLGLEKGELAVRVADGSRASKIRIFAGDRLGQEIDLKAAGANAPVALDPSLKEVPALRVVVEGPAAPLAISELEIR